MSEVGKGVRLTKASGEWESLAVESGEPQRARHPEGNSRPLGDNSRLDVPSADHSPDTIIGVEVGPERAVPDRGFAPVVPNDEWEAYDHQPSRWCVRVGGIAPRLHRPEHFVLFDPGLPHYRRCSRCGQTIYLYKLRG